MCEIESVCQVVLWCCLCVCCLNNDNPGQIVRMLNVYHVCRSKACAAIRNETVCVCSCVCSHVRQTQIGSIQ